MVENLLERTEMEKNIVSVLIISYNQGKYIKQCIESVLAQRFEGELQIIIHDDGSTDNSREIIDKYSSNKCITKVYPRENVFSRGFYRMLTENVLPICEGKYLAFCEADDYWTDVYKIQKQLDALENNSQCALCTHDVVLVDAVNNKIIGNVPNQKLKMRYPQIITSNIFINDWLDTKTFFGLNSLMINRNYIDSKSIPTFFTESYCLDFTIPLLVGTKGEVYYIKECMAEKRVGNDGSLSAKNVAGISVDKYINNLENENSMLSDFDVYTNEKYHVQIVNTILKNKRKEYAKRNSAQHSGNIFLHKIILKVKFHFKNGMRKYPKIRDLYLHLENLYMNRYRKYGEKI